VDEYVFTLLLARCMFNRKIRYVRVMSWDIQLICENSFLRSIQFQSMYDANL
jgi:hypothetical protein